ncbi:MAG: GIY-YIG nuclease family protein [Oligoflexales bacterium]
MNIEDLDGSWIKVKFCRSKSELVEEINGVYALTNFTGTVLYIGKSINIKRRFLEHIDTPSKNSLTYQGRTFWFFYQECEKDCETKVERGLLLTSILNSGKLPPLNKIYAPS